MKNWTAVREGMALRRPGMGLIALRMGVLMLLTLPVGLIARWGINDHQGASPYWMAQTDGDGGIGSFNLLVGSLTDLSPVWWGVVLVSVVLFIAFKQLLDATALMLVRPVGTNRESRPPPTIPATFFGPAWGLFWRFIRIAVVGWVVFIAGMLLIGLLFDRLADSGVRSGATGLWQMVLLPGLHVSVQSGWFLTVAAVTFWCRLILVADDRKRVRRVILPACRQLGRSWSVALALFVLLPLLVQILGAGLLAGQIHQDASSSGLAIWVLYLGVQSYIWYWLIHTGQLIRHHTA